MKLVFSVLFVCLLLVPALQKVTGFLPFKTSLVNVPQERHLRYIDWQDFELGKYQYRFDQWLTHNSGMFGWIVKNNNQLNYDWFKIAGDSNSDTLIGNDYSLFDQIYINDLNGKYHSKHDQPAEQARSLLKIQQYLATQDKDFLLLVHPNKAEYHPEWVPQRFIKSGTVSTYLSRLRPYLDYHGVNYLDVGERLNSSADVDTSKIFVKSGVHFNNYGKCVAARVTLEHLTKTTALGLPEFSCQLNDGTAQPTAEDLDLLYLLNVWEAQKSRPLIPAAETKPIDPNFNPAGRAMIVGTSYVFGLLEVLEEVRAFKAIDFLFYDQTHYYSRRKYSENAARGKKYLSEKMYRPGALKKRDLLIMESTSARLHQLGTGYVEKFLKNLSQQDKRQESVGGVPAS